MNKDSFVKIFEEVFDVDVSDESWKMASWLPGLDHFAHYDAESGRYVIELDGMQEKERAEFVGDLNELIADRTGSEEQKAYLTLCTDTTTGRPYAAISMQELSELKNNITEQDFTGRRIFKRYYERAVETELLRIAKAAFNLDVTGDKQRFERWLRGSMLFDLLPRHGSEGQEESSLVLIFGSGRNGPVTGYVSLAELIETAMGKATLFLQGSAFMNQEKYAAVFGPDGKRSPVLRIPHPQDTHNYILALDMEMAKAMVEAGLGIDLANLVDKHMYFYNGLGGGEFHRSEEASARRALFNRLNLGSLINDRFGRAIVYRDEEIMTFYARNTFREEMNAKTGKRVDHRTGEPADPLQGRYYIDIALPYLVKDEIDSFVGELNDLMIPALESSGLSAYIIPFRPAFQYGNGWAVKIPYDFLDKMLESGVTVDALPVFEKYNRIQQGRIDEARNIIDTLNDAVGYKGWTEFGFHEKLYYVEPRDNNKISLPLGNRRVRGNADEDAGEDNVGKFAAYSNRIKEIFEKAGLSKEMFFDCEADPRGHFCLIEFNVQSLKQGRNIADRLMAVRDEVRPVMKEIIALSSLETVFSTIFDYAKAENEKRISSGDVISEIERLCGNEGKTERFYKAMSDLGSYIDYLVDAEQVQNEAAGSVAKEHLAYISGLSPAFAELIDEARKPYKDPIQETNSPPVQVAASAAP